MQAPETSVDKEHGLSAANQAETVPDSSPVSASKEHYVLGRYTVVESKASD